VGISLRQFEQMKDRVAGKAAREFVPSTPADNRLASSFSAKIVLGVDPSLRGTGYGVIQAGRPHAVVLAQGTIFCPRDWPRSHCLAQIVRTLRQVLEQYRPEVCAVEGLFFAQNLKTAIIMGEARGAAMSVIAEAGLDIHEIATRKVKQAVVGYGAAQKIAVAKMVQRMLNLAELPAPDAADALAVALTHAQEYSRYRFQSPKKI